MLFLEHAAEASDRLHEVEPLHRLEARWTEAGRKSFALRRLDECDESVGRQAPAMRKPIRSCALRLRVTADDRRRVRRACALRFERDDASAVGAEPLLIVRAIAGG